MKKNEQGQSTIEFIFTFAFGLSVILLIFNSAMNYASGYLVHYATFMASRVYLTQDNAIIGDTGSYRTSAASAANQTFARYNLGIFGIQNTNFHINHATEGMSPEQYLVVGAYTAYEQRVDVMGKLLGNTKVNLISESFLGKEPTRMVCAKRMCQAITNQESCTEEMNITLYDDGC